MASSRSVVLAVIKLLIALTLCATTCGAALAAVEYFDIYVGPEKVFSVTNNQMQSAEERGDLINERIRDLVDDKSIDPAEIEIRTGLNGVPVIGIDDRPICIVSPLDAAQANKPIQALAREWRDRLVTKITEYRKAPSPSASEEAQGKDKQDRGNSTLSEHAVLLLFIEIALLLCASLICGEALVRMGQPAIIGQILAGLLLGPTFFGAFFPDLSAQLFPRDGSQSKLIEVISWIGVSFLLMLTGMETDTSMLKRLGKPALSFSLIGLIGPLIAGALISLLLPEQFMGDAPNRLAFAVFIGTIFSASSVPVVAKILMDLNMLKLDIGQLIIATSLAHDLLCCLLLAVIVVLSGSVEQAGNPVLVAIVGTICFVALLYYGRPVFFAMLRWVNDHISNTDGLITGMIVLLLASAAATQAIGVHIVLGAFAAGLILSQTPVINHKVVRPLETVTMAFFAPIFFASSGLNVNLSTLMEPNLGAITFLLVLTSLGIKLVTCFLAGKLVGVGTYESLAIGVGANAKGSLGLILAMLGYSLGIIGQDMYAIVIFISLFSTGVAAPLMNATMAKVRISDDEKVRLKQEERRSRTILSTIRRVLWPTSGKGRNSFIAHLLNSIGHTQVLETTALWVKHGEAAQENPFGHIGGIVDKKLVHVSERTIKSRNPADAITEEGNRGYDLIIMAADDVAADANYVFGQLVDHVILNTSTRVLVIHEPDPSKLRSIKKVLVPVSGSELSISAAEFGISLAKSLEATVVCLSIADSGAEDLYSDVTQSGSKIQRNVSDEISSTLSELSDALDVTFESILMQTSTHPAQAAILSAQQNDIDLIVLGAEPKVGKGLFVGHMINYILRNAPCAVAVLKLRG